MPEATHTGSWPIALGPAAPGAGAGSDTTSGVGRRVTVQLVVAGRTLVELVQCVGAQGYELEDGPRNRPTLEEVFIELTGKRLRD